MTSRRTQKLRCQVLEISLVRNTHFVCKNSFISVSLRSTSIHFVFVDFVFIKVEGVDLLILLKPEVITHLLEVS